MSEKLQNTLALHCSPALFGIKASNLINCRKDEFPNIRIEIELLNKKFNPKIFFKIIKEDENNVYVLVFHKKYLMRTIFSNENYNYLLEHSYPKGKNLNLYLDYLGKRLKNKDFPHEIGVFLGYDLSDIIAFENKNVKCIYTGYWQVYSNLEEKLKIFNSFTTCKDKVVSLINNGYRLENLIKGW